MRAIIIVFRNYSVNAFALIVPDVDLFVEMHVAKEAQTSSTIEGTHAGPGEALLPEDQIQPESRDDWREVRNYIDAESAGIARSTAYARRKEDQIFADQWEDAEQEAADRLEAEAYRRAVTGIRRPLFQAGKQMMIKNEDGTESPAMIEEYSDYLLDRLLRARRPSKFRDNYPPDVSDMPTYKVYVGIDESRV